MSTIRLVDGGVSFEPEATTPSTFRDVLATAVSALEADGVAHAVVGGIATSYYGRPRHTRDVDVLVRGADAEAALEALSRRAFATQRTDERWIYKGIRDGVLVDVLFVMRGGIVLDDEMLCRASRVRHLGVEMVVAPLEDLVVAKAIVHDESAPRHWHDALAMLGGPTPVDWDYLTVRARRGPRRVASLLVYAQSLDLPVPDAVVSAVLDQVR